MCDFRALFQTYAEEVDMSQPLNRVAMFLSTNHVRTCISCGIVCVEGIM